MKRRSKLSLKMSFVKKTIDVSVAEGERVGLLCGLDGHLDEIVRQRDRELQAVVEQRSRGDVYGAVERLHQQGRVYEIASREERLTAIANEYVKDPRETLVVSPDNVVEPAERSSAATGQTRIGRQGYTILTVVRRDHQRVVPDRLVAIPAPEITNIDREPCPELPLHRD